VRFELVFVSSHQDETVVVIPRTVVKPSDGILAVEGEVLLRSCVQQADKLQLNVINIRNLK
jgi:hypothetical protein